MGVDERISFWKSQLVSLEIRTKVLQYDVESCSVHLDTGTNLPRRRGLAAIVHCRRASDVRRDPNGARNRTANGRLRAIRVGEAG